MALTLTQTNFLRNCRQHYRKYSQWLDKCSQVEFVDATGETPLYVACKKRALPLIQELLKRGANPNTYVHNKYPVFLQSVALGYIDVMELLLIQSQIPLSLQATLTYESRTGSALKIAILYQQWPMVKLLLNHGAEFTYEVLKNMLNQNNFQFIQETCLDQCLTAIKANLTEILFFVLNHRSYEVWSWLLQHDLGSLRDICSNDGTLLAMVCCNSRSDEVQALLQYEWPRQSVNDFQKWLNAKDQDGWSAIFYTRNLDIQRLLVEYGANPHQLGANNMGLVESAFDSHCITEDMWDQFVDWQLDFNRFSIGDYPIHDMMSYEIDPHKIMSQCTNVNAQTTYFGETVFIILMRIITEEKYGNHKRYFQCLTILLEYEPDVYLQDITGANGFTRFFENYDTTTTTTATTTALTTNEIARRALKMVYRYTKRRHPGQTVLHILAASGCDAQIINLFKNTPKLQRYINAPDDQGQTPLILASRYHYASTIKLIHTQLSLKELNHRDIFGQSYRYYLNRTDLRKLFPKLCQISLSILGYGPEEYVDWLTEMPFVY